MGSRPRPTSIAEGGNNECNNFNFVDLKISSSSKDRNSSKVTTVLASPGQGPDRCIEISYTDAKVIGNGSFGVVYQAKLCKTGQMIAIKKVLQDPRFKNRELQIIRQLQHCNIVNLMYFFHTYSSEEKKEDTYMNLVLEYLPETLFKMVRNSRQSIPAIYIKVYMYQLFRGLAYIHAQGICHRDIKSENLLLDPDSGILKICDFGSAKHLVKKIPNVSYICSRYYRAPELIFGATDYNNSVDVWSAGCVLAELMLGRPMFIARTGVDQLVEIIKVLGTPKKEEIREMNPNYKEYDYPHIEVTPWKEVFRAKSQATPEALHLLSRLLVYTPKARISPLHACAHAFFDKLREPNTRLPNNRALPPMFNFTKGEMKNQKALNVELVPAQLVYATAESVKGE